MRDKREHAKENRGALLPRRVNLFHNKIKETEQVQGWIPNCFRKHTTVAAGFHDVLEVNH